MKSTETFKTTINNHLLKLAENDSLFAETLKKPDKNIDDCITYILNTVQKSGCSGYADEEIFNMAIHYYDEDNIKAGKEIKATVVVNHKVELSESDIEAAKQKAIDELVLQQKQKLTDKASKNKVEVTGAQSSLF